MKLAVASDHGGFEFKNELVEHLKDLGHNIEDVGTHSLDSCDYPDFGNQACVMVQKEEVDRAILICTNGIGMSMTANKHKGIRAAMVYSESTAERTRQHHNSNVLCLGAQEFTKERLMNFTNIWLETEYEGGRHQRRVDKFPEAK